MTQTEQQLVTESENISTGGLFLVTDEPYPVGTSGFLKIMVGLSDMKKEINAKFIVSHTEQSGIGEAGMGVEFTYMDEDDRVLLGELVGQIGNHS